MCSLSPSFSASCFSPMSRSTSAAVEAKKDMKSNTGEKKSAKEREENRKPKLVHHRLFSGALYMNDAAVKNALANLERARSSSISPGSNSSAGEGPSPSRRRATSNKPRLMKKRRISNKAEVDDVVDNTIHPTDEILRKGGRANDGAGHGPRGTSPDRPLGAKGGLPIVTDTIPRLDNEDAANSGVTEESEDRTNPTG